jgi:tetratricopeptide (TPR) repeat protein
VTTIAVACLAGLVATELTACSPKAALRRIQRTRDQYIPKVDPDPQHLIDEADLKLSKNPKDAEAYAQRASGYDQQHDIEDALSDYNKAISLAPHRHATWYAGRGWLNGNENQALADFNEAIQLDPDNADYHLQRACVLASLGRYDQSKADFGKSISLGYDPVKVSSQRRFLDLDCADLGQMIKDAILITEDTENTADGAELEQSYRALANIYFGLSDYKNAIAVCDKWIAYLESITVAKDPGFEPTLMLARIYTFLGDKPKAAEICRAIIAKLEGPEHAYGGDLNQVAEIYRLMGEEKKAHAKWSASTPDQIKEIEDDLESCVAPDVEGQCLLARSINEFTATNIKLGSKQSGARTYRKVIKRLQQPILELPDHQELYGLRGECHYELGEYSAAIKDFQTAKKLFPESDLFSMRLGETLMSAGKVKQALAEYRLAQGCKRKNEIQTDFRSDLSVSPQNNALTVDLAEALVKDGQYKEAISCADRVITWEGSCAGAAYYWRGLACQKLGDTKGADAGLRMAKVLDFRLEN